MPSLENLYREVVLDHYRNPRNRGELACPPARRAEGFNPLCGDEVIVYVVLDDGGVIRDLRVDGQGCSISQAAASMMSESVKGRSVDEVRALERAFKSMMDIHDEDTDGDGGATGGGATSGGTSAGSDGSGGGGRSDIDTLGDLAALGGVKKFPVRIKCATLCWNTLAEGLKQTSS